MERLLKNIELERAAEIAYDSLKESSRHEIDDSLNKVLNNSEQQYVLLPVEGDSKKYYIMNVNKYKVIFEREPDMLHVHAILSGSFGK
jgi:mRNA-degrading endonuclease RelE of RelBE toxin-antitoxin system